MKKDRALLAKEQELKKELRKQLESELRNVKVRLNRILKRPSQPEQGETPERGERSLADSGGI
jgi:hypothetical protein